MALHRVLVIASASLLSPSQLQAQKVAQPAPDSSDIIVTGRRPTQGVIDTYSEGNIRALGAITIGEVIARLERRNGGRPFSIIVNGRRLADISDLREVPPEALDQLEILANTSANRYGFSGQDKVLNLVLKPRFVSTNADAGLRLPTEGGSATGSMALRYVNIRGERRFNATANLSGTTSLIGRERLGLLQADGQDVLTPYRTLLPSSRSTSLTSGLALAIGSTSVNLSGSMSEIASRQIARFYLADMLSANDGRQQGIGAESVIDMLHSRVYQLGATASGAAKSLNWTAELTGSIASNKANSHPSGQDAIPLPTATAAAALPSQYIPISTASDSANLGIALSANTPIFSLPAGQVAMNTRFTVNVQRLVSINKAIQASRRSYTETRSSTHAGLYIPIIAPEIPGVGVIGSLALSLNGDYERVSRSGNYPSYNVALDWQPLDSISLSLGRTATKNVPGLANNRDPVIYTPGTLVADAVTGEYAVVTRISGGVPNLKAVSQSDTTARLTFSKSLNEMNVSATLEYASLSINNPLISAYPNAFFQRAFPNRFIRDASGRLTSIDVRPFNASLERRQALRPNVHVSGHVGGRDNSSSKDENRGVDWDINVSHEWTLRDVLRPSDGQAGIDLLETPFDGVQGTPRHRINIEASATRRNVNFQLSTRWRSGVKVEDVTAADNYSIDFTSFWTANAEISVTMRRTGGPPNTTKSLRLWLSIDNLLNRRLAVRDSNGKIPVAFLPAFLDPIGRVIALRISRAL